MKIISCYINNFGCYSNQKFEFNEDLTSFFRNNGEGKTTLATFIKVMFYSFEKETSASKTRERAHYFPYSGGTYGGSINIKIYGKTYSIYREFDKTSSTKDILKIYDDKGNELKEFLTYDISLLANNIKLGELIFNIDRTAFTKTNFIYSRDLDFKMNDSIKMKIGDITIDDNSQNTYEDTINAIKEDLSDKTKKKSNGKEYNYRIKDLEKRVKENKRKINELNEKKENINLLYSELNQLDKELLELNNEQVNLNEINRKNGMLVKVNDYDTNIKNSEEKIANFKETYKIIPSSFDIDKIKDYIKELNDLTIKNKGYNLSASDIEKYKETKDKVMTKEDLEKLKRLNNLILDSSFKPLYEIDMERFSLLDNKFKNGDLIKDDILRNKIDLYSDSLKELENYKNNQLNNKYSIDENYLKYIEENIKVYEDGKNKVTEIKEKLSKKNNILIVILTIITFGIYYIIYRKKRNTLLNVVKNLEDDLKNKEKIINDFFAKFDLNKGDYSSRLNILKKEIERNKNEYSDSKIAEINKDIFDKEEELKKYFKQFNYEGSDINKIYESYDNEKKEYLSLSEKIKNNKKLEEDYNSKINAYINEENEILSKYNLSRSIDFNKQLDNIGEDINFIETHKYLYIDKEENEKNIEEINEKIKVLLMQLEIEPSLDLSVQLTKILDDYSTYNLAKNEKATFISEKDEYIKKNNLSGIETIDFEAKRNELNAKLSYVNSKITNKKEEINELETQVEEIDKLSEEIDVYQETINTYKKKVEIIEKALLYLKEANKDLENKYIGPVKNLFIDYANKIYEKIGTSVIMNYDFSVKYDINGMPRDFADLSDGERSILMLCLRFAILDFIYKDHDSVIILDDPFESLDKDKLIKAISVIKELSKRWQIIYFNAHESRSI